MVFNTIMSDCQNVSRARLQRVTGASLSLSLDSAQCAFRDAELRLDLARPLAKPTSQLLLGRDGNHAQHGQGVSVRAPHTGAPSRDHDDPGLPQRHVVRKVVGWRVVGPEEQPQLRRRLLIDL